MAVGKGSMARASKAAQKTVAAPEKTKVEAVAEVKEEVVETKKPVVKKTTTKKQATKKQAPKKQNPKTTVAKETVVQENEIVAVGDEMPIYYF